MTSRSPPPCGICRIQDCSIVIPAALKTPSRSLLFMIFSSSNFFVILPLLEVMEEQSNTLPYMVMFIKNVYNLTISKDDDIIVN